MRIRQQKSEHIPSISTLTVRGRASYKLYGRAPPWNYAMLWSLLWLCCEVLIVLLHNQVVMLHSTSSVTRPFTHYRHPSHKLLYYRSSQSTLLPPISIASIMAHLLSANIMVDRMLSISYYKTKCIILSVFLAVPQRCTIIFSMQCRFNETYCQLPNMSFEQHYLIWVICLILSKATQLVFVAAKQNTPQ